MPDPRGIADSDTYFADCPIAARVFELRAKVTRVLDGDTVVAWIDMGAGNLLVTRVRFEKVNCPERTAEGGIAAEVYTRKLLLGQWVTIHTRMRQDQNGRILGSLYRWDGKGLPLLDVSNALVEAGHATKR